MLMKPIINKLTLVLLLLMAYSCDKNHIVEPTSSCFPNVIDSYKYPITPGTNEWNQLSSIDEAFQVCQLPEQTLKSISTKSLIDAIAHNPMFVGQYLLSSSCPIETWNRLFSKLNCVQELFNRDASGEALIDYYKEIDFSCIKSNVWDSNNDFERLMGVEFLFTKQEILQQLNHQKKQELIQALLSNYIQKTDRLIVIIPMAWIMLNDNYQPMVEYYETNKQLYEQSILLGYVFSKEQSESIISIANNFIK